MAMRQINTTLKEHPGSAPVLQPVDEIPVPEERRRTILTLTSSSCRWPVGDPAGEDFYFCGAAADVGQPYCAHHAQMAVQPAQPRRR